MKRASFVAATCVVAAFASRPLSAQAPAQPPANPREVQPERPTVATHAGTVAPGYLEIETGVEHDRVDPQTNFTFTPTVFKFGAASHLQVSVIGSVVHTDAGTALGDVALGAKWRLLDDAPIVGDFAVFPSVKWPAGSVAKGTGTGTTDYSFLLISSHTFGNVAMDLNAGITTRGGDGSVAPKTATVWTASFGGPFDDSFGWVVEAYGYPGTGGPVGAKGTVALLAGPTAKIRDWLAIDAGLIVPISGPQPHALYAGGVYNVGRLW